MRRDATRTVAMIAFALAVGSLITNVIWSEKFVEAFQRIEAIEAALGQ